METLLKAEAIVAQLVGITSTNAVSSGIDQLNELLLQQKMKCNEAHKAVNVAKDKETDEKLIYRQLENSLDKLKRQRQELRDERYSL